MPGSQLLPGDIWMTIEPNPFTMQCIVKFQTPNPKLQTSLNIYDISGRVVKSFRLTPDALRTAQITWSGTDQRDRPLPSGVYFIQLTAGEYKETQKVLLVR
jgi:flagellar hook assembly protein FlgD